MKVVAGSMALGVVLVALSACGGGSSGDAQAGDASDGALPQETGTTCDQYCACAMNYCNAQLPPPSVMSCMDFCAMFTARERDCRVGECGQAMTSAANAMVHCPLAAGDGGVCVQ